MPNPPDDRTPDIGDRLVRLEESTSFADRRAEELSEEVLAVYERLAEIAKRVERLERRLEAVETAEEAPQDAPPDGRNR